MAHIESMTHPARPALCKICDAETVVAWSVVGRYSGREFALNRCPNCGFTSVMNPWLEYEKIYDENYYRGRGADPLVDYFAEINDPNHTVRRYEWSGIVAAVSSLTPVNGTTKWLDYGCGLGGLVDYLRRQGFSDATGFEQGWTVSHLAARAVPFITVAQEEQHAGAFDVVTAIEVIEHIADPVSELRRMRRLLRRGGLLFMTTGNARPYRDRLPSWRYVRPEIHLSYFEPQTLALALRKAGFEPAFPGHTSGWDDIIRYKLLKSVGRHNVHPVDHIIPWTAITRLVDLRLGVTAHPVGWAA